MREQEQEKLSKIEVKQYLYYALIFCISLVVLIFLPMIGSNVDAGFRFPTTSAGWSVYAITKLLTSILNVLIYHCFIQQGKVNSSKNDNYIKAREILNTERKRADKRPKSEAEFLKKQYGTKAVMLFITTLGSAVALTEAILYYNYTTLLTYAITIFMGVIFGIVEMKKVETYYCNEFYSYALMLQEKNKNKTLCDGEIATNKTHKEQSNDNIQ